LPEIVVGLSDQASDLPRRILDPHHPTKGSTIERALQAFGKELRFSFELVAKPPLPGRRRRKQKNRSMSGVSASGARGGIDFALRPPASFLHP
jgi:hypothetical protein